MYSSLLIDVHLKIRSRNHRYLHSFPTRRSSDLGPGRNLLQQRFRLVHEPRAALKSSHIAARLELVQKEFRQRSEEHTSELQSLTNLVCRLMLEKKKKIQYRYIHLT